MTVGHQDNEWMQHVQLVRRRLTKKEKHQSGTSEKEILCIVAL